MKLDDPERRYPLIVVFASISVQLVALSGIYFIFFRNFSFFPFIFFGIWFFGVSVSWVFLSFPERKLHKTVLWFIFYPYFIWQFFSIFVAFPYFFYLLINFYFGMAKFPFFLETNVVIGCFSLLALGLTCYGFFYFPKTIVSKNIPFRNLDPDLDGYRLLHISDIHIGNFTPKKYLRQIVNEVNLKDPDLILITGDLLTFGDFFVDDAVSFVKELKSKDGVIFSLGNHEYYVDTEDLTDKLRNIGCVVLCTDLYVNEVLTIGAISGVTNDSVTAMNELQEIIRKNDNVVPDILMAHDPYSFKETYKTGVPLTLAGHTHGGQVWNSILNSLLARYGKEYFISGLYRKGCSYLYVNQGLGMSGLPFRLGASPEVTLFIFE